MNDTTPVTGGQREDRIGEAPPGPGVADALFGFAEVARVMLWSVESTRMALDLNRRLLDIGRDMLRRQQDAAIASVLEALGGSAAPPGRASAPDAASDLVRQSFDTFDRMMAAMRAANTAALRAANEGTTPSASERSPEPERSAASR